MTLGILRLTRYYQDCHETTKRLTLLGVPQGKRAGVIRARHSRTTEPSRGEFAQKGTATPQYADRLIHTTKDLGGNAELS